MKVYILETVINGEWALFNGDAFVRRKQARDHMMDLREEGYTKRNLRVSRYVRDIGQPSYARVSKATRRYAADGEGVK